MAGKVCIKCYSTQYGTYCTTPKDLVSCLFSSLPAKNVFAETTWESSSQSTKPPLSTLSMFCHESSTHALLPGDALDSFSKCYNQRPCAVFGPALYTNRLSQLGFRAICPGLGLVCCLSRPSTPFVLTLYTARLSRLALHFYTVRPSLLHRLARPWYHGKLPNQFTVYLQITTIQ